MGRDSTDDRASARSKLSMKVLSKPPRLAIGAQTKRRGAAPSLQVDNLVGRRGARGSFNVMKFHEMTSLARRKCLLWRNLCGKVGEEMEIEGYWTALEGQSGYITGRGETHCGEGTAEESPSMLFQPEDDCCSWIRAR